MKSDDLNNNTNDEKALDSNDHTQESHPPGELKWSRKEEDLREQQVDSEEKDLDSFAAEPSQEIEKIEENEKNVWTDDTEHSQSASGQTSASIEDTLTPMGFKDYTAAPTVEQIDSVQTTNVAPAADEQKSGWKTKLLKILWVPALLAVMLLIGLIIGHSVLGEQPVANVFDIKMWEHLYNLVYSK